MEREQKVMTKGKLGCVILQGTIGLIIFVGYYRPHYIHGVLWI